MDVLILADNLLVAGGDARVTWIDMDLSTKPYKTIRCIEVVV